MSDPARIALVVAQSAGGIGRHVAKLAGEAASRGGQVWVFGPERAREFGFENPNIEFFTIEIPRGSNPLGTLLASRRLRKKLASASVVHGHGIRAGLAAALAARRGGVPHRMVTIHNAILDRRGYRRGPALIAERTLARVASKVICVSSDLAGIYRAAAGSRANKVVVIPVGAEITVPSAAEVAAARRSLEIEDGRALVVAVGRLHPQKGFDVLIESAALLRHTPVPLVVVAGEGPQRSALDGLIGKLGIGDRVRLLGYRKDANALVAGADVFCMPSRWEGSPLALHEAMALGRPIVATGTGGIPGMVSSESAVMVPPENPGALASAVDLLLADAALARRLGESAAKAGAAWPDAARSAAMVADLYEELLGRELGAS